MRPHAWGHSTRTNNFLIGFAPPKKDPRNPQNTQQNARKNAIGENLRGSFLGVANQQENYKPEL